MIINENINMLNTMYPSQAKKVKNGSFSTSPVSSTFGFVLSGRVNFGNEKIAQSNQYFSMWTEETQVYQVEGEAVFFTRVGYKCQNNVGGPLENSGRLCYIDGCSDSLLIYPPRQGDPSVSALFFTAGLNQTFHIHPSIRFGVVVDGYGFSNVKQNEQEIEIHLKTGDMFCIEEREIHRFRTTNSHMTVVAYHPDGDWGPTDHDHTMLNRTYINK